MTLTATADVDLVELLEAVIADVERIASIDLTETLRVLDTTTDKKFPEHLLRIDRTLAALPGVNRWATVILARTLITKRLST